MPIQKMQTYAEFEAQQNAFMEQMRKHDLECISCPTCESQFFEQIEVMKFKADHHVILGQDVPPKPGSQPYRLLRCVHCQNLLEPRIIHNTRDVIGGDYEELLDTLEGKRDKRVKEEEPEQKDNAIPSEEL